MATTNPILDFIFGEGSEQGAAISDMFQCMEYAEEEIAKAVEEHPECASALGDSFRFMGTYRLPTVIEEAYRHHCREILQRIVDKDNLDNPTKVEIMYFLVKVSLKGPLRSRAFYLYQELFIEVMGHHFDDEIPMPKHMESECEELHLRLLRQLAYNRDCKS